MRWGMAFVFLAAACTTSAEPETHDSLMDDLAHFAILGRDGQLTFSGRHPETVEVTRQGQLTLVNRTAPFAVVGQSSERPNAYDLISFYRLPANRIIGYRAGNSFPLWADSKSCPALHDVAKAIDVADIPPPEQPDRNRVICTADCTTYGLTINGSSGAEFSGKSIDNDNVWRVFRKAYDLPCWRAEVRE